MKAEKSRASGVVSRLLTELRAGAARSGAYWAQQLAFSPRVPWEVALAVRRGEVDDDERALLRGLMPAALALLGALPDGCDGDPHRFFVLARRQARALAWGRRRHLLKLARRLGLELSAAPLAPVPSHLSRPYPLIGWELDPPARERR